MWKALQPDAHVAAIEAAAGESLGYTRPWVVDPGAMVNLHASLNEGMVVDLVRIACANSEAGQPPGGPVNRIEPLATAGSWALPREVQPLVPGAQVNADFPHAPMPAGTTLVFALQRASHGRPGHVLSLLDSSGRGVQVRLMVDSARAARLAIATITPDLQGAAIEAERCEIGLDAGAWLLLAVDLARDEPGIAVRHAYCDASLPNMVPLPWALRTYLSAPSYPAAFTDLRIGTLGGDDRSADFRIDLLSLLPQSIGSTLTPDGIMAAPAAKTPIAPWEQAALDAGRQAALLRGQVSPDAALADLCGNARTTVVQRPYSAVRGLRWDGSSQSPLETPAQYTALHFNSDTLLDAHWRSTLAWQVPADLPSGSYAFRWRPASAATGNSGYASFFVTAARCPTNRLAVLLPTFCYLAYANATEDMRGPPPSAARRSAEETLDRVHPACGRSLYERHPDGHGVIYSGSRRPLLSVTPGHRPWGFVADSWLMDWLERRGIPFDIITDHDVHSDGAAALTGYDVIISGHHPEYWSTPMWDALWRYLHAGGRMLYLGGNGFYWRTAVSASDDIIEVRRAEDGTRPSIAAPGEYHCALSGEYGGLWRRLGRPPQRLTGVGMAAQGFVRATHFRKREDAIAAEMAFVFEGVEGETFGAHGLLGGGASGWEIDRFDLDLGSPPGTWWLASSEHHDASMLRTKEELLSYIPPFADAKARSDVTLAPIGAGDVFAVGSMTWVGSLHGDQGSSDIATITENVIRRFLDPAPIPRKAT